MALTDTIRNMVTWWMDPPTTLSSDEESANDLLRRVGGSVTDRPWRVPSVRDALGVPAIQRAVSLISSTTGMLSMQGVREGVPMDVQPSLLSRPDPYHAADEFYAGTAADMAKYGEFVWWIASRDGDQRPAALVRVPLHELAVEEDPRNRLMPRYKWGTIESTRYSTANPGGQFVHRIYPLADPFALRGRGPLQLCGAAASVAVEAQNWAANFYAEGGYPNINLHDPGDLSAEEAAELKSAWIQNPANTPQVTSGALELRPVPINSAGASMLDARQHNNGDAARIFGIPGSLLEYQSPGASLTYQNLEGEFTKLVRTCLQPLYLEPIEKAMSDLLTRSTVARFNSKAFMRADAFTRFRVHKLAIDSGIYDAEHAQREEGILPGDVEYAPVPASPPAAVPSNLPRTASRVGGEVRCPKGHLLAELASPPYRFTCFRCKASVAA
jgi:HK97 family phage portal protein